MNILGIDYGTKNIGLAWCDTNIGVPLPFGVIKSIEEVIEIIRSENIDRVIIGLPIGLDGKENNNTMRVRKFADQIRELSNIEIDFFDERFSSHFADQIESGVSRDEKSAMIILSDYLEKNKK